MTTPTALSIDLRFITAMPRQRHFLSQLLPALLREEWCAAVWLSASLARGDADRWSDVNLHLLAATEAAQAVRDRLLLLLDGQVEQGWTLLSSSDHMIKGFTSIFEAVDARRGAVHFELHWVDVATLPSHLDYHRSRRLLFAADDLPPAARHLLERHPPALVSPEATAVEAALVHFWEPLSRLPAVLNRREWLATAHLIDNARQILIDLVVALNGAERPHAPARVNAYLGPAQLEAFEKTLLARQVDASAWIGQAVALIVLYRWYAPQLVEMYAIRYPDDLEWTTLALLSAEVDGWPALIQTG